MATRRSLTALIMIAMLTLLKLGLSDDSVATEPTQVPVGGLQQRTSVVECDGDDWFTRNCTITHVVVWQGKIHILVDDPSADTDSQIFPPVNLHQYPPGINFTRYKYITPATLAAEINATTPQPTIRYVRYGILWGHWSSDIYHVFMEYIYQIAARFCMFFGLCNYDPAAAAQTQIFTHEYEIDPNPVAVKQQLACFTSHPPIPLAHSNSSLVVVVDTMVLGFGGLELPAWLPPSEGRQMPLQYVVSLRRTLIKCLNIPPNRDFAPAIYPPTVTFLQRKAHSHRSFLNLPEVLEDLRATLPGVRFQVVIAEGKDSTYIARAYQRTTVLIQFHGAAMVHLGFLPRRAAVIDINPAVFGPGDGAAWHALVQRVVRTYSPVNNLTFIPIEIQKPEQVAMMMGRVRDDPDWQALPADTRLEVIESGQCPEVLQGTPSWIKCRDRWLSRDTLGVLLDGEQLLGAVMQGLEAVSDAGELAVSL